MILFQDDDIDSVCDACENLGESTGSKDSGVGLVILRKIGKQAKEQDGY